MIATFRSRLLVYKQNRDTLVDFFWTDPLARGGGDQSLPQEMIEYNLKCRLNVCVTQTKIKKGSGVPTFYVNLIDIIIDPIFLVHLFLLRLNF